MTELEKVIAGLESCRPGRNCDGCPYHELFMKGRCNKQMEEDALAILKQMPRWIPIKSRPLDEEERKEWKELSERLGFDLEADDSIIYTSQLPDDGDEVITCNLYGTVDMDTFCDDGDCIYFENNGDMDGIVAWMPKPKPYKPTKEDSDAE